MTFNLSDLTDEAARETVEQLLIQLDHTRRAVELQQRRAAGIRKLIDGLVEMVPALEDLLPEDLDDDEEPRPRGAEAVRRILVDKAGVWCAVAGVVDMLDRKGWTPQSTNPANAVRTALERLVEAKTIEKSRSTEGAVIYRHPKSGGYDEEPF